MNIVNYKASFWCIFITISTDCIGLAKEIGLDRSGQLSFQTEYDDVLCSCHHVPHTRISATSVNSAAATTFTTFISNPFLHNERSLDESTAKSIFSTPSSWFSTESSTEQQVELASSLMILEQSLHPNYNFQSPSAQDFLSTPDVNQLHNSIKTTASIEEGKVPTRRTTVRRQAEFPSVSTNGARVAVDLKSENLTVITVTVPANHQEMSRDATVAVNVPSPTGGSHISLSITSVPSGTSGTITFSTASGDSVVSFMIPSEASGTAFIIEVPSKFSKRPIAKDSTRKAIIKIVHESATAGTDLPDNTFATPSTKDDGNTVDAKGATQVESTTSIYQYSTTISTSTGTLNRTERAPTTIPTEMTVTDITFPVQSDGSTKKPEIAAQTTEKPLTSSTIPGIIPTTVTIPKKLTTLPQLPTKGPTTPSVTMSTTEVAPTITKPTNAAPTSTAPSNVPNKTEEKIQPSSHWIRTVLVVSPSMLENETFIKTVAEGLGASYRAAYQQFLTLHHNNGSNQPLKQQDITVQIINATNVNTTVLRMEFIYYVTQNGTPIDAATAIKMLSAVTDQEMAILLGHVLTVKAEPYYSVTEPMPLQSDSGSVMLPAILGTIFTLLLLVIIIVLLLRFNSTRKRRREQLLIIKEQQRQQELEESYGSRNRQIAFLMDDGNGSLKKEEKIPARSQAKKVKRSRNLPSSAILVGRQDKPLPKPRKLRGENVAAPEMLPKIEEPSSELSSMTDFKISSPNRSRQRIRRSASKDDKYHQETNGDVLDTQQLPTFSFRHRNQPPQIQAPQSQNPMLNSTPAVVDQCDTAPDKEIYTRPHPRRKESMGNGLHLPESLAVTHLTQLQIGNAEVGAMSIRDNTIMNGPDEIDTVSRLVTWNDAETQRLISSIKDELKKVKESLPSPQPPFMDV